MVGVNTLTSPQPGCPIGDVDPSTADCEGTFIDETPAGDTFVPTQVGDLAGTGVSAEVGAEVVFTGKRYAASATIAYVVSVARPDTAHQFRGWLAVSYRPGDLRFTAGPTYGVIVVQGMGVADWYDRGDQGPQGTAIPAADLPYGGSATMAGFQFTAGYGVVDLQPLMGTIELGGAWSTDGNRSYLNAALRVGVVPRIRRFDG